MTRPVQPRAQQINRKLADLAEAGTLKIGNLPGQVGIGTAEYFVMQGRATKDSGRVSITKAGRQHLWREAA